MVYLYVLLAFSSPAKKHIHLSQSHIQELYILQEVIKSIQRLRAPLVLKFQPMQQWFMIALSSTKK